MHTNKHMQYFAKFISGPYAIQEDEKEEETI
jgi:hypothetical protein